jgi:hypothetical protein
MSLPIIINTAKYEVELPLSKMTVEYRPYLVKEEKVLMMAMESRDEKQILRATQDIIEACTFDKIRARDLPTAELELLFLKLRAKSVGETSKVGHKCKSCEADNELIIDLNEIQIDQSSVVNPKVMITDEVGVMLKYPTTDDINKIIGTKDKSEIDATFSIITSCIDAIFDKENVYEASSIERKDINEFVESLSSQQFEKIKQFFEGMPKLKKDVSFTCSSCGTHNELVLEGLQNFFV